MSRIVVLRSALVAAFLLGAGCSQGGSAPAPGSNAPPVVSAGADRTVDENSTVALAGAVTDPDSTPSVQWSQIAGPAVTLSNASSLSPQFTAPLVAANTTLTFRLTANDGVNAPVSDDVSITVRNISAQSYTVNAETTGPAITAGFPHLVSPPTGSGAGVGLLLVFMPGTNAPPSLYTKFIDHAASIGYHVIGLSYVNGTAISSICEGGGAGAGDVNCQKNIRTESFTGANTSPYVNINAANSIQHRLSALLAYLIAQDPSGGWNNFYAGGAVQWNRLALAGHSQGGGFAAFIAQRQIVSRALMFASTEAANWTSEAGLTPANLYFGFVSDFDDSVTAYLQSWSNLLLSGSPVVVDSGPPGPGGSHRLRTARTSCSGSSTTSAFHQCTVSDSFTPVDSGGNPVFASVWNYMLGVGN